MTHSSHDRRDSLLFVMAGILLSVCFVSGGSSAETGIGVMIAELIALPVLLYAMLRAWQQGRLQRAGWAVAVVALIVALPLLQLLPLPEWLWKLPAARTQLLHDLGTAGVNRLDYRWSLAPAATERDLFLLLPAVALFFSALATSRDTWRRLLWWLVALVLFTTLLAFAQLGAPQDSFLNPFPQFLPAMTGVFANKNHQASALAIGLVLVLSLLLSARARVASRNSSRTEIIVCAILAVLFGLVLPLVGSRAGVIIALVVVGVVLLNSGMLSMAHLRANRRLQAIGTAALVILGVGIWGAFAWMQNDVDIEGSRWTLIRTTFDLGFANAPLGSGFGSFVLMFEQVTQGALMHSGYINNAHNDYVQWWFEGGVLAVLAMLAALAVLILAAFRLLKLPADSGTRMAGLAALAGVLVLLLHSTVDYPLRTPALMAVFGLLSGILIAATTKARERKLSNTPEGSE